MLLLTGASGNIKLSINDAWRKLIIGGIASALNGELWVLNRKLQGSGRWLELAPVSAS